MDFEITVNGTTYNLNDGAPFCFSSFVDISSAEVVRLGRRSPLQDSMTDLGYRLAPRTMQLSLHFYAATAATLDTYRDTLAEIFKPTASYPLELRVERDDGTARTLNCHVVGEVEITLDPLEYAAKLHRATITLRAANPVFKAESSTTATFSGTSVDWWTAGGAIGTATVMEHTEWPTQGQAWTYTGTITSDWLVAFRSGTVTRTGTVTAFQAGTSGSYARFFWNTASDDFLFGTLTSYGGNNKSVLQSGTANYFVVNVSSGNQTLIYVDQNASSPYFESSLNHHITGTARTWRASPGTAAATLWESQMPKVAVYNANLSQAQRFALSAHMEGTAILGTVSAVNSGDLPVYPNITIYGPMINPILTNVTTGQVINLYGYSIGSAEIINVNLTGGDKTVTSVLGSSQLTTMGTPVQLANWYLAASPTATGGTNSIRVQGGSTSTATRLEIFYHNQYMSF